MTEFKSWYLSEETSEPEKSDFGRLLSFEDYLLLNTVCRAYHAAFGYDIDEDMPIKISPFSYRGYSKLYTVKGKGEDKVVRFKLNKVEKTAKGARFAHKTVILRLNPRGESRWEKKPSDVKGTCFDKKEIVTEPVPWYELPKRTRFVGPLSERTYIHVVDPYEEVELRSEEKEAPIMMDDILFASRALCCGGDRTVQQYQVSEDNGSTLVLCADIDNWST